LTSSCIHGARLAPEAQRAKFWRASRVRHDRREEGWSRVETLAAAALLGLAASVADTACA
jgi:hypothetical protein